MNKDTLRNDLLDILDEVVYSDRKFINVRGKATNQILSLLEGSLPPKNNQRCGTYWEMGYRKGWNTCLQEIKEKLK